MKAASLLAVSLLAVAMMHAQDKTPVTIDFTQPLHTLEGTVILNADSKPPKPLTLSDIVVAALEADTPSEQQNPDRSDRIHRIKLAIAVLNNKSAKLTASDYGYLEDRIEKITPTIYLGPALKALDPTALQ